VKFTRNSISINLVLGDITDFTGDAIVNPANRYLVMGGGVAAAIKRRGGDEIEIEARRHAPLDIGRAVVTSAGRLKCRAVIHAPAVEKPGGRSTPEYVYKATLAALRVAREHGFKSIAFPLMGAGVGGLTPEESVNAMLKAITETGRDLDIYIYVTRQDILERIRVYLKQNNWMEA